MNWYKCSFKDKKVKINSQIEASTEEEATGLFIEELIKEGIKDNKNSLILIKDITNTKNKNKKGNLWKN